MSRSRSLTPEKQAELCRLVAQGLAVELAADQVGVTLRTVQREMVRDEDFEHDLRLAELSAPVNPLKLMEQAARTHWRAAAWLLERTDPRYAKRKPNTCTAEQVEIALAAVIMAASAAAEPGDRAAVHDSAQAAAAQILRAYFPRGDASAGPVGDEQQIEQGPAAAAPPERAEDIPAKRPQHKLSTAAASSPAHSPRSAAEAGIILSPKTHFATERPQGPPAPSQNGRLLPAH